MIAARAEPVPAPEQVSARSGRSAAGNSIRTSQRVRVSSKSSREDAELMQACRQFEGLFLSMLFRAMMKTTGMNDQGPYGTIAEQAFGEKMAEAGGIGLAKVLFDSLAKSSPEIHAGDDRHGGDAPA